MFKLVRWVFLLIVLFVTVGFSFLLGLSFGLGNNHDKFIAETVPVLSMLGGWVAGFGALAAVLTTLWLADKQRREDVENVRVSVKMAIADTGAGVSEWFIAVTLTSDGKRTAKVTGLSVESPHTKTHLQIFKYWIGGDQLPASLAYGDSVSLHLEPGFDKYIRRFVDEQCRGNAAGLRVVARTTLHEFIGPLHKNFLTLSQ